MASHAQTLRTYSTIKIGGPAEKILFLNQLGDLLTDVPQPIRILGNGSNILMDDRGLKGTVILTRDFSESEPEILSETSTTADIFVSVGMYLPKLSSWAAKRGLSGCEYMIGVPGTVGGAILQNAGANEQEMQMILKSVVVFDLETHEEVDLDVADCQLTYRHSFLKSKPNWLVTSAVIQLQKKNAIEIQNKMDLNLAYRKSKTPYSKPSLGSIYTRLKKGEDWIYPGQLIEAAGLKGLQVGGAAVSPVHANYIVNEGGASFEDVIKLMERIESRVFEDSGHRLEREILVWTDR